MIRREKRISIVRGELLAELRSESFQLAAVERHGRSGADLAKVRRYDAATMRQHFFAPK